ncbi:MAG: multidrug effflux MFS transporter [Bdellovibrionaceae bacterium]|nr:multidrug effflux MFS transporter [Pseudobdellovibrionaceae bacterium]
MIQTTAVPRSKSFLILILGLMTAVSPFSIDMYLPAFSQMAKELDTTVAQISLSLSSYFVGIALGQLVYGPLLDRFGRKKPLYVGFLIYIFASLGCVAAGSADALIVWRLVQALGGCAAGVASMAMVRDLFDPKESAKIFSLLILILGASPLLAPTIGGYLAVAFGWHSLFVVLAAMGLFLLLAVRFFLPETHEPDLSVSLKPGPIAKSFLEILKHPQFFTYSFTMSIAFSGLFVYLAGSPSIFLGFYGVDGTTYGWIFAIVASGFILSSQLNVVILKRFSNQRVLWAGLSAQVVIGLIFLLGSLSGWFGLYSTVGMFFLYLSCFGFVNPNATAMVLAPFPKSAGRASAMMGFLQMSCGAIASMMVGIFEIRSLAPVVGIVAGTSAMGLLILAVGTPLIHRRRRGH